MYKVFSKANSQHNVKNKYRTRNRLPSTRTDIDELATDVRRSLIDFSSSIKRKLGFLSKISLVKKSLPELSSQIVRTSCCWTSCRLLLGYNLCIVDMVLRRYFDKFVLKAVVFSWRQLKTSWHLLTAWILFSSSHCLLEFLVILLDTCTVYRRSEMNKRWENILAMFAYDDAIYNNKCNLRGRTIIDKKT